MFYSSVFGRHDICLCLRLRLCVRGILPVFKDDIVRYSKQYFIQKISWDTHLHAHKEIYWKMHKKKTQQW